jgi:hypothetical protein
LGALPAASLLVERARRFEESWNCLWRYRGAADEMGVRGCGKKAVYVYVAGNGWVNNTGVQQ